MIDRRNFLKLVSFAGGIAVAGKWSFDALSEDEDSIGLKTRRWAMVIDVKKCEEEPECNLCIQACHNYHNVPNLDNSKEEIKWIWKDEFRSAFITQENEFLPKGLNHKSVILLCNHCATPPLYQCLPNKSYLET